MTDRESNRFSGFWWQVLTVLAVGVTFTLLFALLRTRVVLLSTAIVLVGLAYPAVIERLNASQSSVRGSVVAMLTAVLAVFGVLGYGTWLTWRGELAFFEYLFVPALALVTYRVWSVLSLAFYQSNWDSTRTPTTEPLPAVSVVIPAYNEEGYVGECIESVLAADYPTEKLELLVVDDGSSDGTFREAAEYVDRGPVRVLQKENGGKYSALNYAMSFVTGTVVVPIDADCTVGEKALETIVAPLRADPNVGAVAGDVRIANRMNLLTHTQMLEYVVGINLYRRLYDALRAIPVVPGCLGAFRYSALEHIDNYDPDTLTEDFDVTIQLLKAGYEVRASTAVTYTEAPETWSDFYRQRIRWYRGNAETLFKHFEVFFDPDYGSLHSVAFPVKSISMVAGPLITIAVLASIVWGIAVGKVAHLLLIFAAFTLIASLVCLLALQIHGDDLRLAFLAPFQGTVYKLLIDAIMLKALFDVGFHTEFEWTGPERVRKRNSVNEQQKSN